MSSVTLACGAADALPTAHERSMEIPRIAELLRRMPEDVAALFGVVLAFIGQRSMSCTLAGVLQFLAITARALAPAGTWRG